MDKLWKKNWEETKTHFNSWWNHTGMVLVLQGKIKKLAPPHENIPDPGPAVSLEKRYLDPEWIANYWRHRLSKDNFLADHLPIAGTDMGVGSLGLYLGAEPGFEETTVWFKPCLADAESRQKLAFDPEQKWWKQHEKIIRESVKRSNGNYFVGCPNLVENIDILSALRDPQGLMMDMLESPEWVKEKIDEINQAYFEVYDRIYDLIKLEDGSATFGALELWGAGKTAKLQCDASAMISPDMFNELLVPALTEQCRFLDYSMYHLDGTQAICHLDRLLAIPELDAIQWTPQAGMPKPGDKCWYDLYKRILNGGKSLQVNGADKDTVVPLLDEIGTEGVYLFVDNVDTEKDAEWLMEKYYK